jgi:hypothetical protein
LLAPKAEKKAVTSSFAGVATVIEPPPPVDIKFNKMSRDGKIKLEFNQPLKVPNFGKSGKGRGLISMSDIDVARDIMSVQFISRNDDEGSEKDYFLELDAWESEQMVV